MAETAEFYFNRGVKKNEIGDYSNAIEDFNKSIQLNPFIGTVYFHRGVAKFENGYFKSALRDFDKSIELYPEDSYAYYNRGLIKLNHINDFEGAILDFNESIKINPFDQPAVELIKNETKNSLAKKILAKEHELYPKAILKVFNL